VTANGAGTGGLVVGFDLDMTLVDSRAAIGATLQAALAEVGVGIAPEQAWPYNGVPLELTLDALAPHVDKVRVVARYRELYPRIGVPPTTLLPGAAQAVAAVHARGGRVLVVSTKVASAVRDVLAHVGLDRGAVGVDEIAGGLFGAEKGIRLAAAGAQVYVGDHPGDVEAAKVAGAVSVAVATGPHDAEQLAACGADVVLPGLRDFPDWLARFEPAERSVVGDPTGS
jgi:phosphoglycolate phosphatase